MINHIYSDGSIGHEYEIGDSVINNRTLYPVLSSEGILRKQFKGKICLIEPYDRTSWIVCFMYVTSKKYGTEKVACWEIDPYKQKARKKVIEKD